MAMVLAVKAGLGSDSLESSFWSRAKKNKPATSKNGVHHLLQKLDVDPKNAIKLILQGLDNNNFIGNDFLQCCYCIFLTLSAEAGIHKAVSKTSTINLILFTGRTMFLYADGLQFILYFSFRLGLGETAGGSLL